MQRGGTCFYDVPQLLTNVSIMLSFAVRCSLDISTPYLRGGSSGSEGLRQNLYGLECSGGEPGVPGLQNVYREDLLDEISQLRSWLHPEQIEYLERLHWRSFAAEEATKLTRLRQIFAHVRETLDVAKVLTQEHIAEFRLVEKLRKFVPEVIGFCRFCNQTVTPPVEWFHDLLLFGAGLLPCSCGDGGHQTPFTQQVLEQVGQDSNWFMFHWTQFDKGCQITTILVGDVVVIRILAAISMNDRFRNVVKGTMVTVDPIVFHQASGETVVQDTWTELLEKLARARIEQFERHCRDGTLVKLYLRWDESSRSWSAYHEIRSDFRVRVSIRPGFISGLVISEGWYYFQIFPPDHRTVHDTRHGFPHARVPEKYCPPVVPPSPSSGPEVVVRPPRRSSND